VKPILFWCTALSRALSPCLVGKAALRHAAGLVLASQLLACGQPAVPPVRIAISQFPPYEFFYLAQEMGYFRDAGVDVRIVEFQGLADAAHAVRDGRVDAIATTAADLVTLRARDRVDLRAAWVISVSEGADVILGRPNITSLNDLKGRSIGLELDSVGAVVLDSALEQAGLTWAAVQPVGLGQLGGEEALINGRLDALVTYPPVSTRLVKDHGMKVLFDTRAIPGKVLDVLAVRTELSANRADSVRRIIDAYERAKALYAARPAQALQIMARREQTDEETFQRALTDGLRLVEATTQADYMRPGGRLELALGEAAAVMQGIGLIGAAPPAGDMIFRLPEVPKVLHEKRSDQQPPEKK